MASWRSVPLFIARFIPIVLILTLSFFWIQEIRERTSIKQELESTTERLLEAENRIQETTSELERARQEAQEAKAETRYLVEQLGERDEHIRRMLAEMIRLLAGSADVDLGEISIPKDEASWQGVKDELKNFVTQPPMRQQVAPITHRVMPTQPMANNFALKQMEVEHKGIGIVPGNTSSPQEKEKPVRSLAKESAKKGEGRILAVNHDHHFVVINQGLKDGFEEGMTLVALREGKQVGELQVETTYEKISAAGFNPKKKLRFEVGDTIQPQSS